MGFIHSADALIQSNLQMREHKTQHIQHTVYKYIIYSQTEWNHNTSRGWHIWLFHPQKVKGFVGKKRKETEKNWIMYS